MDLTPFSFEAPARLVDFMRQADQPGLINLAAGVPSIDQLPVPALKKALDRACLNDGKNLFSYHHPHGDRELRELLAKRLAARGVFTNADEIIITTGCTQALQIMLAISVQPGDIVACEAPAYYGLLELISQSGAQVVPIRVADMNGLDLQEAEQSFQSKSKPKCLVVCSSLSNPSGATIPIENRKRLVKLCQKYRVRLIEDDIYAELVDGAIPAACRSFDDGSIVSVVSSFSKTVSPGLRVGYCLPGTLVESFAIRKSQQDLHSAVISEAILRELLKTEALDQHLSEVRKSNAYRRTLGLGAIREHFPEGTVASEPGGGYMIWVRVPQSVSMTRVRELALQEKIVFSDGKAFFAKPPVTNYLRLNCARASEEQLLNGIKILGELCRNNQILG